MPRLCSRATRSGACRALLIEDGECLIDSAAILDYLDERVCPRRALLPAAGAARRDALKTVALATGICDKTVATLYERRREASNLDRLDRALPRANRG
jgi:glutathione S-transferase